MTKNFFKESATSLSAFSFLAIALSGVMMFFHLYDDYVEHLHEWVGLFFVVAIFFHVFYNFKGLKNYFAKRVFALSALAIFIVSLAFVMSTPEKKESPKKIMLESLLNAPLKSSLSVLGIKFLDAKEKLALNGIIIDKETSSIQKVAKENSVSAFKIVEIVIAK